MKSLCAQPTFLRDAAVRGIAIVATALALAAAACAVSQQQEVQMGQRYSQQVDSQLPIIADPDANRYINQLGNSIASLTSRRDLQWHFHIVNSPIINAFALPGGYIYVDRGLIEAADQEDEVAGVLGHEIGHVVKRHSIKQMQQMQEAQIGVALTCTLTGACGSSTAQTAINAGGAAIFAKFSRDDEKQADDEGFKNALRAGYNPQGMVSFFQKLLAAQKSQPTMVDQWFASHPTDEARIADIQGKLQAVDPSTLARLRTDSPTFQAFKQHLHSLPQPPKPAPGQPTG